jgi:sortase A
VLRGAGLCLLLAGLALWGYYRWDSARAAASVETASAQLQALLPDRPTGDAQTVAAPPPQETPEDAAGEEETAPTPDPDREMPVVQLDGQDYIGRLDIPELELSLPVLSQWSYPNLKIAPCRYRGSAYQGNLILAAHNYKSHFGKLRQLQVGSPVTFTDMDGTVFHYQVAQLQQLQPTAIQEMEQGDWALTLFTCTQGGSARLAVRCTLVEG